MMDEQDERKHRQSLWDAADRDAADRDAADRDAADRDAADRGAVDQRETVMRTKLNEVGTKRMSVTYGFVLRAMFAGTGLDALSLDARSVVKRAMDLAEHFPEGLTLDQAQFMLDHPGDVMPDEDILPDARGAAD